MVYDDGGLSSSEPGTSSLTGGNRGVSGRNIGTIGQTMRGRNCLIGIVKQSHMRDSIAIEIAR